MSSPKNTSKSGIGNKGLIQVQNPKLPVLSRVPDKIEPRLCPRYEKCSVPICPLGARWFLRTHLPEDRTCRWLTEGVKPWGQEVLAKYLPARAVEIVLQVIEQILKPPAKIARITGQLTIRRVIEKAAKTPSKLRWTGKRAS